MTDSNKQADFQKAQALLPWYAKGELSTEKSLWLSKQIDSNLALKDELNLIQKQISITENYIKKLDTEAYEDKPERLSNLMDKIHGQSQNEETSFNNKTDKKGLWAKLISILPQSQGAWQTAGALALGIMVVQGVVISQLYKTDQGTEYTTLSGEGSGQQNIQADDQLVLLTRFDLNATVYDVDALLTKYNLSIINGPDAGGIYQLTVNDKLTEDAIDKIIAELEAQDKIIKFIAREN